MTTIEITVPELPENRRIHSIMSQSLESLACLFHDCEDKINNALVTCESESVTISHSIVVHMGKNKQTDKLSVNIKQGDEITASLADPDQAEMFDRTGKVRTVTPKTAKAPALVGLPVPSPVLGIGMADNVIDAEEVGNEEE